MSPNLMSQNRLKSRDQRIRKLLRRQRQRGQIVVEYVLLLAITVSLAILITKTLIGRDNGNPGFVLAAWQTLITQIGADLADDVQTKQQ